MRSTYIVEHLSPEGTAYKIIHLFGKGGVDMVHQMLTKHGVQPREIIRAPDRATLEQITKELDGSYKVMYVMGK